MRVEGDLGSPPLFSWFPVLVSTSIRRGGIGGGGGGGGEREEEVEEGQDETAAW